MFGEVDVKIAIGVEDVAGNPWPFLRMVFETRQIAIQQGMAMKILLSTPEGPMRFSTGTLGHALWAGPLKLLDFSAGTPAQILKLSQAIVANSGTLMVYFDAVSPGRTMMAGAIDCNVGMAVIKPAPGAAAWMND